MAQGPKRHPRAAGRLAAVFGLVVVVLAGPAIAQPLPEFSIGLGIETPRALEGMGDFGAGAAPQLAERRESSVKPGCMSNRQLRKGLRGHDFDNIEIGRQVDGDRVEVRANYGGSLYQMTLDRCSGKAAGVEKVGRNGLGGVGLQFGY